jgi:hypothetical protein
MSLDNIQFSPIVLQDLYKKTLFDLKTGGQPMVSPEAGAISHLGNNQRKIVIIVMSSEAIYLPDEDLKFLLGILSACKLNMEDIALVNASKQSSLLYNKLTEQFSAEKIFLFGVDLQILNLPLQFPYYQVQHFNNQVYVSSASLTDLQNDKVDKMKLWNCLKKVFSLG